jgi:hypothetical protein
LGAAALPVALTLRPTGAWATSLSGCTLPIPTLALERDKNGSVKSVTVIDSPSQAPKNTVAVLPPANGRYSAQELTNGLSSFSLSKDQRDAHIFYVEKLMKNPNFGIGQASCVVSINAILINKGYNPR